MSFISWSFLILLALVLVGRLYWRREKTGAAYRTMLLVASLVFYGWHVPYYLILLLFSTTVDFWAARWIEDLPREAVRRRRAWVVFSLVANLGLLGYFKYTNFFLSNLEAGLSALGIGVHWARLDLILPMGLSFYTFVALSYTLDVYRGELKAERSFSRFLLFVSFFPHLMAGPVIRARDFLYQLDRKRRLSVVSWAEGGWLVAQGLFLKMVCANNLAVAVEDYWKGGYIRDASSASLLVLVLLFSGQILCDFAGYSSMARGMAYWLGFRFPVNFNNPYLATSFRNFWQRWHITLSTWLRDYLYISLGGNRQGRWKTYRNLMLTMVLGGLWHGAARTFVIWGVLHGGALALERLLGMDRLDEKPGRVWKKLAWFLVVQAVVLVTWVFFRAVSVGEAMLILTRILSLKGSGLDVEMARWSVYLVPVVLMHVHGWLVEQGRLGPISAWGKGLLAAGMVFLVLTCYGPNSAFIYFQF